MRTRWPDCTLAMVTSARQAVSPATGIPAASSKDRRRGFVAMASTEASAYSAYEPPFASAMTASPTFQGPVAFPTASMTPERSLPGMRRVPAGARAVCFQSAVFTEAARTLIRTSPGCGSGLGIDSTWKVPSTKTTARMFSVAEATQTANVHRMMVRMGYRTTWFSYLSDLIGERDYSRAVLTYVTYAPVRLRETWS